MKNLVVTMNVGGKNVMNDAGLDDYVRVVKKGSIETAEQFGDG